MFIPNLALRKEKNIKILNIYNNKNITINLLSSDSENNGIYVVNNNTKLFVTKKHRFLKSYLDKYLDNYI